MADKQGIYEEDPDFYKPVLKQARLPVAVRERSLFSGRVDQTRESSGNRAQCLSRILRIHWPETISNENLLARVQQTPVEEDIYPTKEVEMACHTLRKPPISIGRQALNWNSQGQRKRGRPRNTWRRELEKYIKRTGHTRKQLKRIAQNRGAWRVIGGCLCSGRSKGPK